MVTSSALLQHPADYEPDWRVVYYELDVEAVGPSWDNQVAAMEAFQEALRCQGQ